MSRKVTLPVSFSFSPLGFNFFKFAANKGQRITVDVVAARLGSPLDPVVRLLDAKGRELVYCDDEPGAGPDSRFVFKAPAAGDNVIELRDANYQGGASYRYRLRVGSLPLASVAFPPVAQVGTEAKFKLLGPAVHGVKPVPVRVPENAVRIPAAVKYPGGEGSGFVSVFGSPLPTFVETEPNDSTNTVNSVTIPIAINGERSVNSPPGFGVMTSLTCVPAPSSESSQRPEGSIEPGPDLAGGPCQASFEGSLKSVH